MERMLTREVKIGKIKIGGNNPVAVQSMCNTKTSDVKSTVGQILRLENAGCDIVRVAVPDMTAAESISEIKKNIHIPLVADIHFDYRLALSAIENGADKVRINPGNIGSEENIKKVLDKASEYNIPIRIGVNSGSLEKHILAKHNGRVTAEGLCESALYNAGILESYGFKNIVISIKSSDVLMCVKAHEMIKNMTDIPLHIGITEAGTVFEGNIKSAAGLGILLYEGIGDTVRVSLTGDPVDEVKSAVTLLRALKLRNSGIEVVSCPTCGRTSIDLISLANRIHELIEKPKYSSLNMKVACMGCVVNGPGEAKEAELGICGGINEGLIIKKGEILRKVPESSLLQEFEKELDKYLV